MDRAKYLPRFVDEAHEMIDLMSNHLLAYEASQQKGDDAAKKAALDEVFRSAHSLKGMASTLGFQPLADLAHVLEDLADVGRNRGSLEQEILDALLDCVDVQRRMVDEASQSKPMTADGPLVARLASLRGRFVDEGESGVSSTGPTEFSQSGTELEVVFEGADGPAAVQAFMVLRAAMGEQSFLESIPTKDGMKQGDFTGVLRVLFLPDIDLKSIVKKLSSMGGVSSCRQPLQSGPVTVQPKTPNLTVVVSLDETLTLTRPLARVLIDELARTGLFVRSQPTREEVLDRREPVRKLTLVLDGGAQVQPWISQTRKTHGVTQVVVAEAKTEATALGIDARSVRVKTTVLDGFIDSVGELLLTKNRLNKIASQTNDPSVIAIADDMERVARELHHRAVSARMMPLSSVTKRLPAQVRKLARTLDRRVDFEMSGDDIELDRAILDEISPSLEHLIRNAVDHGHAGGAARLATEKNEAMELRLSAWRQRDSVFIELSDDGKGIDADAIGKRAVEKGVVTEAVLTQLSVEEKLELIALPGFTTRDSVSETSGRGVGMDVVKSSIERVGGILRIRSTLGKGTAFVLELPPTVAILRVLVVEPRHDEPHCVYAIPVHRVERAVEVVADGTSARTPGGAEVPVVGLGKSLGFDTDKPAERGTAILIGGDRKIAFDVGKIVGQEEVVVKPLGAPLSAVEYLSGAALLADGRCAYILEPHRLLETGYMKSKQKSHELTL